nr:MAG: hypothetical protein [Bacteriophage sp.]
MVLKTGWEGLANLYHEKVNFGGTKNVYLPSRYPLNVRASKVVVLKGEYGSLKFNI